MRKPLLLLVDDDRAVLEALEAELAPAFGEICRIESFDDPRAVLEALPRWEEEGRSIAVAIVDQRMPVMTGVELLSALWHGQEQNARASADSPHPRHPAVDMHSILLTGYSDLDAAIAAKNEAAVDRYQEKPWQAEALQSVVAKVLSQPLLDSALSESFLFREVISETEIRHSLRLRHEVYRHTPGIEHVLPQGTDASLDVDAYDAVSRFFALIARQRGTEKIIGTLRVTSDSPSPSAAVVSTIVEPYKTLLDRFFAPRQYLLPMMTYLVDREAVAAIVAHAQAAGEQIVEPGRLTLHPVFRATSGAGERHLARHIIEGAVAFFFFFLRIEHALLTCAPAHAPFYRPLGFREAEGTRARYQPELDCDRTCLHGRIAWVPSPARERCQALAARITRTGAACRCATFPACLGGPYERGDFTHTDLFCPLRAEEVLAAAKLEGR